MAIDQPIHSADPMARSSINISGQDDNDALELSTIPPEIQATKPLGQQDGDPDDRISQTNDGHPDTATDEPRIEETEDESTYPNATAMAIIMAAISMAMFLVSLVCSFLSCQSLFCPVSAIITYVKK